MDYLGMFLQPNIVQNVDLSLQVNSKQNVNYDSCIYRNIIYYYTSGNGIFSGDHT